MGLFDRWLNRPAPAHRQPAFEPTYELTVRIGDEVSSIEIPIEPDWGFSTESAAQGPRQTASQCWIPASRGVEVGGRRIRGLIYVGENLPGADTEYWLEPALINPTLPATTAAPGEPPAGYWPSYDRLSVGHRGSYLDWLAGPRRISEADQSYLFLYIYGLERRLLFDAKHDSSAAAERGTLVAELRRMGGETTDDQHGSFGDYLTNLLDFIAAQDQLAGVGDAEPPREKVGWDVPMALRLMMGEVAAAELPLPAELATSWVLTSPEAYLRNPAERCATEFTDLFELRDQAPRRMSIDQADRGAARARSRLLHRARSLQPLAGPQLRRRRIQRHGAVAGGPARESGQTRVGEPARAAGAVELRRGAVADRGRRADRPLVSRVRQAAEEGGGHGRPAA
jgi:TerB N-terminal domain